jgi:hypothetical protein
MGGLISCGDINKNIVYVLIGAFGKIFAELAYKIDKSITKHPFIIGISSAMGMCLSIIPLIMLKIKSRNIKQNLLIEGIIETEKSKEKKKRQIMKKYFLIFSAAILDFTQKILSYLFVEDIFYNFWIFDMLCLSIFSYIILKSKLYIHQYVSLIAMIIIGISLNIINLTNEESDNLDNNKNNNNDIGKIILNIGLVFLIEVIYSLINVINKYSMEYCYCVPYEISFYQGLFALIIFTTLLIIFTNKEIKNPKYQKIEFKGKKYLDNFYEYIDDIYFKKILVFIIIMICRLLFNLFSHITVKCFTPSHVALILLIGEITFIFQGQGDNPYKFYGNIIIFIICLFMLLIYTEIIELNFFGLSKNTRKNIGNRARRLSYDSDDSYDVGGGMQVKSEGSDGKKDTDQDDEFKEKLNKTEENTEIELSING